MAGTLARLFKNCGYSTKMENKHIKNVGKERPQDITVKDYEEGFNMDIDVTFRSPLSISNQDKAKKGVGILNDIAEKEKIAKYKKFYNREDIKKDTKFIVFAMETTGGFGKQAIKVVSKLAYERHKSTKNSYQEEKRKVRQILSAKMAKVVGAQLNKQQVWNIVSEHSLTF